MMNKGSIYEIFNFDMEGEVGDEKDLPKTKVEYVRVLHEKMRDTGYVPVLDLNPISHVSYDAKKKTFTMDVVVHGVWVGEDKSWKIEGMSEGNLIPRSSPKGK